MVVSLPTHSLSRSPSRSLFSSSSSRSNYPISLSLFSSSSSLCFFDLCSRSSVDPKIGAEILGLLKVLFKVLVEPENRKFE
ncbi:hypothetical protein K1719_027984 [Acacia pycnantha]|nr:hypothetical protein K1719_027984 [Acacia pycnantha]